MRYTVRHCFSQLVWNIIEGLLFKLREFWVALGSPLLGSSPGKVGVCTQFVSPAQRPQCVAVAVSLPLWIVGEGMFFLDSLLSL
jgi:hypothetical protein